MRSILSLFALLLLAAGIQAQRKTFPNQIKAGLSDHGKTSGDTVYFRLPSEQSTYNGLARFFNRNLRMPQGPAYDEMQTGTCNLHFILDTTGTVVHSWCEQISNEKVAREVLRVAQKLGKMQPTTVAGRPVKTEIEMSFGFFMETAEPGVARAKTDIVVIGYPPQHKKAVTD